MCGCCVGAALVWGGVCVSFLSFFSQLSSLSLSLSLLSSFFSFFPSSLFSSLFFLLFLSLSLSLSLSEHCVKNRSTNKLRGVLM